MTSVTVEKTVREVVQANPAATRVFEALGIDYCCGGDQSLDRACHAANVSIDRVLESIEAAERAANLAPDARNWQAEPLADLIEHIKSRHHKYVREEVARLGPLFDKVCAVHGENHPELLQVHATFVGLAQEMTVHMMKEDMMLFPYIVRLEEAVIEKQPAMPSPFGSVKNPVAMMMRDHDDAGEALRELRQTTNAYTAPPGACISFQTLYRALAEFEADLHQHIHLENNILFPRAVAMERAQ